MSQQLVCPSCGNTNPVQEGEHIVICSSCHLRFIVKGADGLARYRLAVQVNQEEALQHWQRFLASSPAIDRKVHRLAKICEVFLVHIPFWHISGETLRLDIGKKTRSVTQEKHQAERIIWNRAACDVREFGINQLDLTDQPIQPFPVDELVRSGMVFEPVESPDEALAAAQVSLEVPMRKKSHLLVRIVKAELSLVYYPLWVVRYVALGQVFQVVVDGNSGDVLYGKAPGSVTYRAAALVLGFLLGAIVTIDLPVLLFYFENKFPIPLLVLFFVAGLLLMYTGWCIFRQGAYYQFERDKPTALKSARFEIGLPREARELLDRVIQRGKFRK